MKPKIVIVVVVGALTTSAFLLGRISVSPRSEITTTTTRSYSHRDIQSDGSDGPARSKQVSVNSGTTQASGNSGDLRMDSREERLETLASILRNEDVISRNRAFMDYLNRIPSSEIKDAMEHFTGLGIVFDRWGEYSMLLSAWAKHDPIGALAHAQTAGMGFGYDTSIILTEWASKDPEAALQWAEENHKGEEGNPHFVGIIKAIVATDPARATELLQRMPAGRERGQALDAVIPHILAQGNEKARQWLEAIQDDRLFVGAMSRVAGQFAVSDPKMAADWLLANSQDAAKQGINQVMSNWASKNPEAATSFYRSLPAGEIRTRALGGMVESLAGKNARQAADLIDANPGDVDDRIIHQFTWQAFESDPALATGYISRMSDGQGRDRAYQEAIGYWLQSDPAAARAWLRTNQLPESLQPNVDTWLAE